jgi:HEAT repeat protein
VSVSKHDVLGALLPDEPDYAAAASWLGPDAASILVELAQGDDVEFASKATSLAGFMNAEVARQVLVSAARHPDPIVRVAAAAALSQQPALISELAAPLLADADAGVRKWILRSLRTVGPTGLEDQIQALARDDPIPALRELASEVGRVRP